MGLFKKIFSRKSRKRFAADTCVESLPPVQERFKPCRIDDTEAEVSRLLRSSSARYAAEPQIGLSSLPPLPHPIDSVVSHPKSSTTTLASVSARSTYSVTIHSRTVHSRTEFPNAYPPMDMNFTPKRSLTEPARRRSKSVPITPRDNNRLLLLRQDPSVASLLNHYDEEGRLNSALFSNTPSPQKQERVQTRRTGSTLRQLLGRPSSPESGNSGMEGDISWAEKFLGETDGNSSVSSIGPRTPADTHFTRTCSIDDKTALPIECDTSASDHCTFSSLEVELSASTDLVHSHTFDSPQRASEIFEFLGAKKRADDGPVTKLSQFKTTIPHYRRFSAESTISDPKYSHIPPPRSRSTHIPQPTVPASQRSPLSPTGAVFLLPEPEDNESIPPQPVISPRAGQSTRGPRGPRPSSKIPSRQSTGSLSLLCDCSDSYLAKDQLLSVQSVLSEKSNADSTCIARPRDMHSQIPKLRSASGTSSSSAGSKHDFAIKSPLQHPVSLQPAVQAKPKPTEAQHPAGTVSCGNENDMLSRLPQPVTPIRLFALHPPHLHEPTSPASSSELSPVARQMMANLRQQRIHARQREREAGRLGSSQSRIRY